MLTADKNATLTEFQIQTLQIREKELNYFVAMYNGISGIGSMLAGFGFSSLRMSFPEKTNLLIQILYLGFTACAIGLELCAILNSATCSVFGPGKFLRGKGGLKAADEVVRVLEDKSETTLGYFMGGLICILISSSLKAFIQYSFMNAVVVSLGLCGMAYLLVKSGKCFSPILSPFFSRAPNFQRDVCRQVVSHHRQDRVGPDRRPHQH